MPTAPVSVRDTPLRPAAYAGVAAAAVSIVAAVIIRFAPAASPIVTALHFLITITLFVMGGALAARLGGSGWRAGSFAGLVDALVGHPIAFLLAKPLDPAAVTVPAGVEVTPQLVASMHLWGAVLGAIMAVLFATAAGAVGGWYARRSGVVPQTVQ